MSYQSARILNPPTPDMLDDKTSLYRFLNEIYNRSGGFQSSSVDLKGLTASVAELNTLEGIRLDEEVQQQLNSKLSAGSVGTIASQNSNNVDISGGSLSTVNINNSSLHNSNVTLSTISECTINLLTGSTVTATPSGIIYRDFVAHGVTGSADSTLGAYSLLASTLFPINSYIEIIGFGTYAATATNKRIRLVFGSTTLYDTTALAINSGFWKINCIVSAISSNMEKCITEISSNNALLTNSVNYVVGAEVLTNNLNISFIAQGTNTNDIVQEGMIINYYKG